MGEKDQGQCCYFGPWSNPDAALEKYLKEKDFLYSGRKPRQDPDALTIKELCNHFLNAKKETYEVGEITERTYDDYKKACKMLVEHFAKHRIVVDLMPNDFAELRNKMAAKWSATTLGNVLTRMRVVSKFAVNNALVDRMIPYGQGFKRPSKETLRIEKARQGAKLFTREEILQMLLCAGPALECMILLGINCGFGNADCGQLPLSAVDLDKGWIDFPRPKTGFRRRCPLWPETVKALQCIAVAEKAPGLLEKVTVNETPPSG